MQRGGRSLWAGSTPPQAKISLAKPHILLLDEPTNHLDLLTVIALADALRAFDGGIVLPTPDTHAILAVT